MLTAAFVILIIMSSAYYSYCMICIRLFKRTGAAESAANCAGVSLMIPICGVDEGAYRNWISLCRQDHDNFEVLFCVLNRDDAAVPVLEKLVKDYRRGLLDTRARNIALHACPKILGKNHQINNMMHLLKHAHHERIIFADSDIRVTPDYLRRVTAPLADPSVGVVTCGYLDRTPKSLGAAVAAFGRGVDFIPAVLIARRLDGGLRFAIGPTIATRKSVLRKIGGLETLINRIGSDYHIGRSAAEAGYRVELSDYVLGNNCGKESLRDVFLRELRWARTIRLNRGVQYYGMGLCYGTVYCIPLLAFTGFQAWSVWMSLAVLALRLAQIFISIQRLNSPRLLRWLWVLPIRELMSFVVWLGGTFGRRVYWRGRWLSIGVSGIILSEQRIAVRKLNRDCMTGD